MVGMHTGLVAVRSDVLERWIQIGLASGRVINLSFPDERPADATTEHPLADRLQKYLDHGSREGFADVEIALTVPTDHRQVYETLREVEYGRSLGFDEFVGAVPLDADDAESTVRTALQENPIPLILPDHRINGVTGATPADVRRALRGLEELD